MPATCGLDIDVPAIAWNSSPGGESASGNGELPATIWRPGAVTSGLMMSGATAFGPRDEKIVIDGAVRHVVRRGRPPSLRTLMRAVGFALAAMYALIARPGVLSTWTDGTQWLSVNRLSTSSALYMTIPTPPASKTALLFSRRPTTPRRHSTIVPVPLVASSLPGSHSSLPADA